MKKLLIGLCLAVVALGQNYDDRCGLITGDSSVIKKYERPLPVEHADIKANVKKGEKYVEGEFPDNFDWKAKGSAWYCYLGEEATTICVERDGKGHVWITKSSNAPSVTFSPEEERQCYIYELQKAGGAQ